MKKIDSYISIDQYQQYPLDIFDHIYLIKGYRKNNQSSVMSQEVQDILKRFMPKDFIIARSPEGRPYAISKSGHVVSFSLSHCSDNLILAVSSDQNIGIDLECLKERALSHRIAKRYFNDTGKLDLEEFYQCWTAAESLSKASGESLWQCLRLISFSKESEWQLCAYKINFALIGQHYIMALCRLVGNNRRLAYLGGDAE